MRTFLFLAGLLLASSAFAEDVLRVRVPSNESKLDVRHDYDHRIIDLLLAKTEPEFGPYKLIPVPKMTQFRAFNSLANDKILDLVTSTSNIEREEKFIAVKHSIHKSLMGVRVFLIRKEREKDFAAVRSMADLQRFVAGQGADWTDVGILRANGLDVRTGLDYDGLFQMLATGRFDYFPRSVVEVQAELQAHRSQDIVLEKTIALIYSQPAYIFVNKKHPALARRFERGWEIVLEDGSFERLFRETHLESLTKAGLADRRLFFLKNPYSSEKEPDLSFLSTVASTKK